MTPDMVLPKHLVGHIVHVIVAHFKFSLNVVSIELPIPKISCKLWMWDSTYANMGWGHCTIEGPNHPTNMDYFF